MNIPTDFDDLQTRIANLRTRSETPPGQEGNAWAPEFKEFAASTRNLLASAAGLNVNGEVTADVNNTVTNSEELSSTSADVGELSVGTGGTVSTIPLQDEDHEVIDSTVYSGTSESTTSTTYENAFTSVAEMGLLAGGIASSLDYSNYYLQLVSTLHIDDANETVYHKLKDGPSGDPNAEISHTGDTGYPIVVSDLIPYNPYQNGYARISTEMKVSGGSGTVYVTKLALIGEI